MMYAYHQGNQRQLGIKTETDQRHKFGDKRPCSALSLLSYLSGLEAKNVRQKRENIESRMTLLTFSRLQIENYVMTAFSIQPIRTYGQQTIFLRAAVAKFQYPCVNGLIACYCFGTNFY